MNSNRVTITEVAKKAGVSLGSASRALNHAGASSEMIERVELAAAELGYSPDAVGRSLRTRRTYQIAFAVADIGNPVYVEMLKAVEQMVAPRGYRVLVTSTGNSSKSTADLLENLQGGFVDGIVVSPLRIDDDLKDAITRSTIPVVVIGRQLDADSSTVSINSADGIGMAYAHLLDQGVNRIGFVNGPEDTTPGTARLKGYKEAAILHQNTVDLDQIVCAEDFTVDAGKKAARRLLEEQPDLEALIAANDLLAVGTIKAAHELGIDVPKDLLVTGMDDTDLSRIFDPPITSVSLLSGERARISANILLDQLELDEEVKATNMTLDPRLVIRKTTSRKTTSTGYEERK